MKALAKGFRGAFGRFGRPVKAHSEPDPAYGKPRPMTGLKLSPEQRAKAAAYTGSINHGDPALALKR